MQTDRCNHELLRRYLRGECSGAEDAAVEQHLTDCADCRKALQAEAADETFWAAASSNLDTQGDVKRLDPGQMFCLGHRPLEDKSEIGLQRFLVDWLEEDGDGSALGRLQQYQVKALLDTGGMGLLLKAWDTKLHREVAIKTLRPYLSSDSVAKQRFLREARLAASIESPHVVGIFHVDTWRQIPYLVMPFLGAGSLSQCGNERGFSFADVLSVGRQVASGLAAAHGRGLIHRDIKPSNILLNADLSDVVIADFGLARAIGHGTLTDARAIAGTPQFMSPEQAQGGAVDERSDLFSLGTLLYWMLAGCTPFEAESTYGILMRVVAAEPPKKIDDSAPDWFWRLIRILLSKEPMNRTLSAAQIAKLLGDVENHGNAASAVALLPPELASPTTQRRRWLVVSGVVAGVVAMTLGTAYWQSGPSAKASVPQQGESTDVDSSSIQKRYETASPTRQGALDALDRVNLIADLKSGLHVEYWLKRLDSLPASQTPAEAIPLLESLQNSGDPPVARLAHKILSRNPFAPEE